MPDAFQAFAGTKVFAVCCRCGVVEMPGKGTLDEAGMQAHVLEVSKAITERSWSPPLETTEAVQAYATQLRKSGWHISRFHPIEASLCQCCWTMEERCPSAAAATDN